jgi:hypothetical protein
MLYLYMSHEDVGRNFANILQNLVTYALCTYMFTYSYILTLYIYIVFLTKNDLRNNNPSYIKYWITVYKV